MALGGRAPPESVVISVRLKDDAPAGVKVGFTPDDPAEDVKEGILLALGLEGGIRFRLLTVSGTVRVTNGNLPAGEYTVELIHSAP